MAKTLAKVHSTGNLQHEEKRGREETVKKYQYVFDNEVSEGGVLDVLFTKTELNKALKKLGKSSPGTDKICYSMLENLSDKGKDVLLSMYNKIWMNSCIPRTWKESIIIPIRKPGKDPHVANNYRPIALTSQMGKTMERMINDRLAYWMEHKGLRQNYQSGFRKGRGTMDPIVYLEDTIRKAQVNKESVVAVFFDIEKAYDMLWKDGMLIKLRILGIKGKMFQWIKGFLSDRTIQVKINWELSKSYSVENGVPQRSIISPLLFSIMIDDVFKDIQNSVGVALFADDGAMWKKGRNIDFVVDKMQQQNPRMGRSMGI